MVQMRLQPGGCGCCGSQVCVLVCGSIPLYGALVQVYSGPTLVGSCTTGAGGCCNPGVSPGTYTVTILVNGDVVDSNTRTIGSGTTTISIPLPSSGVVCCGPYYVPYSLTLTDAIGPLTLTYQGVIGSLSTWCVCRTVTLSACTSVGSCTINPPASNPVAILYVMTCNGSSPYFTLTRTWPRAEYSLVWQYYSQTPGCVITANVLCSNAPPPSCCSPCIDTSSGSANASSSSPFAVSFTMTPDGGNILADPVGGNVTVTQ